MKLCSNNHDEICFLVSDCPLCLSKDELSDLKKENEKLELKVDKLELDEANHICE